MEARMQSPAALLDGANQAIYGLITAIKDAAVPGHVLDLVHLRASQLNGCSACVDGGVKTARKAGETEDRLHAVAAWREAPYFTDAERAALALAEHMTRLADRSDPVPDDVWAAAAQHYEEKELAGIVTHVALTNFFNRLNATTRQVAGAWG